MENAKQGFAQKKVEVGGVSYTLQKIPFRFYLDINDKHTNRHGVLMKRPYSEDLLKYCVVAPKVTLETFDADDSSLGIGMELVGEVESFLVSDRKPTGNKEESQG